MKEKSKINKIAMQSRKWIIEAMLKLLAEKPYEKITITEIAYTAQLGRRTFYRNFDSKEDVLDMYIKGLIDEYINLLKNEYLTIHNGAKVYFTFWSKHLDFLILMEKNNLLHLLLQRFNQYLPMIHKEVNENKIEKFNDRMLEYVLFFSAGGFWNILVKWLQDGAKETPDDMAMLIDSILSDKLIK
ncbi:AcrR family transcriptional regulator [Clostridium acetobutylicum]|nr:AcrR family transcriptional regulator [Clostridium acetobutylicum]